MKTSPSFATPPSLFQIAAFFDDFFPAGGSTRASSWASDLPFADIMVNPDKLMKLLKSSKTEHPPEAATGTTQNVARRATRSSASKKNLDPGTGDSNGYPTNPVKKVEFTLKSPSAKSVKLAGDFTEWEKSPVEMSHVRDGLWRAVVPLVAGSYHYRFIVDGHWCDDPASPNRIPNPFGTENAVIQVS